MATYRFIAIDDAGNRFRGTREAPSEAALSSRLREEGRWLAEAHEIKDPRASGPGATIARRVPRAVLMQFFFSVSLQLKAGVPTFQALTFGLDGQTHAGFRSVHADVLERVKAGTPLSEALANHGRVFPPVVCNLIRAGEASGRLSEACGEVRQYFERVDRLAADIRQALLYPLGVLVAVIILLFVLFSFFIPRFTGVLRSLGVPLPALTRGTLALGDFLAAHHIALAGGVLAFVGSVWAATRFWPAFARLLDAAKLRLPLVGPILAQVCMSRFAQNLASLYRAGIPLLDGLQLCESLVGNREVQAGVAHVAAAVRAGRPLHAAMAERVVFPPMVVQMTALGENSGSLDRALEGAAEYYQAMVPRLLRRLFSMFEPAMILGLLVIVGIIALSIVLPIAAVLESQ